MQVPSIEFSASTPESLIEIIDLQELYGRRYKMDHDPEVPHRVRFSMLINIEHGSGTHFVDFAEVSFNSGDLIFVSKHQINAFDLSKPSQGSITLFTDEFIQKIQSNMKMPVFSPTYLKNDYSPVLHASESLRNSCAHLLSEIKRETVDPAADSLTVMLLFSALFLMIEKERSSSQGYSLSQRETWVFVSFMKLLENQFRQTRNATDYADLLFTTYKTLNQLCKKATDQTVKQLIDVYIILEARHRLTIEKKSVQEIAYEVGFDEVSNFT